MPHFFALAEAILRQVDRMILVPELESGFSFARVLGVRLEALADSVCVLRQEWRYERFPASAE